VDALNDAKETNVTLTCRCEEILSEEIVVAIASGARTVDDVKRRTRAGMGACQGIFCVPVIAAMVAQATGVTIDQVAPMTARPPVRPISLVVLADLYDGELDDDTIIERGLSMAEQHDLEISRLTIDYRNSMAAAVGPAHGVSDAMLDEIAPRVTAEHVRLMAEHAAGGQRWMDLPSDTALAAEINAFAADARDQYRDFILVGIGGSSLGAIATVQALAHPYRNLQPDSARGGPRFFVLDNPDPEKVAATLETVDLPHTLVNVVTKSGQTTETMANFLAVRQALEAAVGPEQARQQIVATTDPTEGLMRQLAEQEGYRTFPVPPGVDGRMTVLSAVGLLPSALCGCDIDSLLAGARAMRASCASGDLRENPAYLLASLCVLASTRLGKSILVTMPYADALFGLSDWFRQLWAESLGKRLSLDGEEVFAGQTPIKALGAIDQHSQIQLYTEGPNDKLISLIAVDRYRAEVTIYNVPPDIPELAYLQGAELGALLQREQLATAWALTEAQRSNFTIKAPTIDAAILGEFFYLYELQTVMGGALLDVNPFGQPGVEAGKNATYALMGREGYESLRAALLATRDDATRYQLGF
jgi:glucose-6-phosphate isomerase